MANGRSIKRRMAKEQAVRPPSQESGMAGAGLDAQGAEFAEAAVEGSSYEGRSEHLMTMIDPEELDNVPPEQREQLEMINGMMTDMIYNPKTKEAVQGMLTDVPPEQGIPRAVNMIMTQFENFTRQQSGELPLEMKFASGMNAFGEITEMAQAMGKLPKDMTEEQTEPLLKATMEQYVMKGLKDKTIDPIELQLKVEPLLTPEEQLMGRQMGDQYGVPGQPTQQMANENMMMAKTLPLQAENEQLKKQNTEMNTALTGMTNAVPDEGV